MITFVLGFLVFVFCMFAILLFCDYIQDMHKKRLCGSTVAGYVIGMRTGKVTVTDHNHIGGTTRRTMHQPCVEYWINGHRYEVKCSTWHSRLPKRLAIGKEVEVFYEEENPDNSYIKDTEVCLIAGLVFAFVTVLLLVLLFMAMHGMIFVGQF